MLSLPFSAQTSIIPHAFFFSSIPFHFVFSVKHNCRNTFLYLNSGQLLEHLYGITSYFKFWEWWLFLSNVNVSGLLFGQFRYTKSICVTFFTISLFLTPIFYDLETVYQQLYFLYANIEWIIQILRKMNNLLRGLVKTYQWIDKKDFLWLAIGFHNLS